MENHEIIIRLRHKGNLKVATYTNREFDLLEIKKEDPEKMLSSTVMDQAEAGFECQKYSYIYKNNYKNKNDISRTPLFLRASEKEDDEEPNIVIPIEPNMLQLFYIHKSRILNLRYVKMCLYKNHKGLCINLFPRKEECKSSTVIIKKEQKTEIMPNQDYAKKMKRKPETRKERVKRESRGKADITFFKIYHEDKLLSFTDHDIYYEDLTARYFYKLA